MSRILTLRVHSARAAARLLYALVLVAAAGALPAAVSDAGITQAWQDNPSTFTFARGVDGYQEATSTTVSAFDRDTRLADRPTVRVRSANARKVLLRWTGLERRLPAAGFVVSGAKLRLYVTRARNPEGAEITAHEVLTPWDAATATWSRRSAEAFWGVAGMHEGGDYDPVPAGKVTGPDAGFTGWIEIPLSPDLVQRWIGTPGANHGLVLKALQKAEPGIDDEFHANTCEDAALRPQLVVEGRPGKAPKPVVPLRRLLEVDTTLPAYVNLDAATLGFRATPMAREPLRLVVSFAERATGQERARPARVEVAPGGKRTDLRVGIREWPDGDTRVSIREVRSDGRDTGEIVRAIRKQTIHRPAPPAEPVPVKGLTTLLVDDWYLSEHTGLRFRTHAAEGFPVTAGMLGENRPMQRGQGLSLTPEGDLVVRVKEMDRREGEPRFYTARSRDGERWEIRPDLPQAGSRDARLLLAADKGEAEPAYRHYDPAADGPPPLSAIRLQYTGKATQWGSIAVPARSVFPVWSKSPGERVILRREPLLQDRWSFSEGDLGDWSDTNDNFAGQWLSRDGKTLFYCQGRTLPRFPPFRIPWDNLATCNRILVVWRTQDGLQWTPSYFAMPTEEEPVGTQHYGAWIRSVEGGSLLFAYLYAYDQARQQIRIEVSVSRDGLFWQRYSGQPAFADNGEWGSWRCGHLFPYGLPVEKDGRMFQLMGYCSNRPHFYWEFVVNRADLSGVTPEFLQSQLEGRDLAKWPFWPQLGSWQALAEDMKQASQTVGVVRFRKDGWVSLSSDGKRGRFTTRTLEAGQTLALNARTQPGGSIRVEVLDAAGKPIPAYCGANAATLAGDSTAHAPAWSGGTIRELPDQPIRLRVSLDRADLFALTW